MDAKVSTLVSTFALSLSFSLILRTFEPSTLHLVRFPSISVGNTMSSNMASWTAVRVLERGLNPLVLISLAYDFPRMLLWAMITTWRPENFFSSSLTTLHWMVLNALWSLYGTYSMIALRPPPQSISLAAVTYKSRRVALNSESEDCKRASSSATESSNASGSSCRIIIRVEEEKHLECNLRWSFLKSWLERPSHMSSQPTKMWNSILTPLLQLSIGR